MHFKHSYPNLYKIQKKKWDGNAIPIGAFNEQSDYKEPKEVVNKDVLIFIRVDKSCYL